jgi:uncharacterized secreted protein with C-terminal beta-propeller domain
MARRALLLVLAAVVAAVPGTAPAQSRSSLVRFDSCQDLARFARARVVQTGGGTGVPFRGDVTRPAVLRPAGIVAQPGRPLPAAQTTGDAAAGREAAGDVSTTNVQETGVDEPDLVKTDGKRLFVVSDGVLRVLDVTGPAPRPIASLKLDGSSHVLLLRGERLLVLAEAQAPLPVLPGPAPAIEVPVDPTTAKVLLTEVVVSTPTAPRVARTMELSGRLAGARLTGGTARVVVASTPEPIEVEGTVRLRRAAARARAARWVPRTTIRSRITRRTFRRSVVPCDRVRHPRAFSGLDLLSVLTVDLDRGLYSVKRDAVMAGAQDVYASARSLVVASRRYAAPEASGGTTELHVFDAGSEPSTVYRGSGSVPGFVLNQFSMSEHEGALRVATTEEAPFGPQGPAGQSESGVSVLRLSGGRLQTAGRVAGLGKGERIYAVRFLGDRGYVVTFRQVDPLYTLDLADPERPRVTGELKVTGFSAYLHPISDSLLLGIGQDATEQGRGLGPQVSLFDVGDPARPRLAGRAALGGSGASAAEQDHHAFLWWAPARLAVVPLETYDTGPDGSGRPFSGAVAFRVTGEGVAEIGRVTHPAPAEDRHPPPIGRSVVAGGRLFTVSAEGIATNALGDLAPLAFTPLG